MGEIMAEVGLKALKLLLEMYHRQQNREFKVCTIRELVRVHGDKVRMMVSRLKREGLVKRVYLGTYKVTDEGIRRLQELGVLYVGKE